VQNGTTVTFSTNLGPLSPTDARTVNGVATAQFIPNGQSGVAEIRATSGAAKPADTANPTLKINVGSAAAGRVLVTANPNRLGSGGGISTITAVVTDTNGNTLSGIPVSFSTDAGTLSSGSANTNSSGQAVITLATNRDATVTATSGSAATSGTVKVTVGTLPDITIAVASGTSAVQGQSVTFNVTVTPGSATDPFTSIVINYGDGTQSGNLGTTTTTAQHVYTSAGTFTATATGTTAGGDTKQNSTVLVVQPMLVTLGVSKSGLVATLTAVVSPAGTAVSSYFWDFGDGQSQATATNSTTHTYVAGTYTARVTLTGANGQTASSASAITLP
jgi:adhesin/invasin